MEWAVWVVLGVIVATGLAAALSWRPARSAWREAQLVRAPPRIPSSSRTFGSPLH